MSTHLNESVADYHAQMSAVEAALAAPISYDFIKDPMRIVARLDAAWIALKHAAQQTMQGNNLRQDMQGMLAQQSNRYRECARRIQELREPKVARKRQSQVRAAKRQVEIERFVLAEVQPYWKADAERRWRT